MSDEDELTTDERLLEETLATLRPAAATLDVGQAMFDAHRRVRRTRVWQAAAIAVGVGVGGWLVANRGGVSAPLNITADTAAEEAVEPRDDRPVQLVYRQALAKSVAELEAVLDRQSRATTSRPGAFTTVRLTGSWAMRSDFSTLGEM